MSLLHIPPRQTPQTNGGVIGNYQSRQEPTTAATEAKLIGFPLDSDKEEGTESPPPRATHRPPPTAAAVGRPAPQKSSVFGDFDPWGTATSTAQTMNLLDLEENLSPPSDSEQSEVRTVGTEAFKKKSSSLRSSPVPLSTNQFDPFGPLSGGDSSGGGGGLGEVFGNPNAFALSSSTENLPSHNTGKQPDFFSSNFLSPTGSSHPVQRHSSAPNVAALGNPSFAPSLSDIPQSPKQGGSTPATFPAHHTHPATAPNYNPSRTPTSAGRTSPYGTGGHQLGGTTFHARSTGQLQQPIGGRGRGGKGGTRADPFADLGNLKSGGTTSSSAAKQQRPQTVPQGHPTTMTNRSTYQYYGQQPSRTQQPPAQNTQAAYQPNYSSSVLGDRGERGVRSKTGQSISHREIFLYTKHSHFTAYTCSSYTVCMIVLY